MASHHVDFLQLFFITLIFFTISFHSSVVGGQPPPIFNYSDTSKWGNQSPSYMTCSLGKKQSPINIITKKTIYSPELGQLKKVIRPFNATLKTDGKVVEIQLVPLKHNTTFIIHGKTFILLRTHWHTPSEHRFNGIQYAAEQHQVYQSLEDNNQLAVIGILYKYGKPDPLISVIEPYLKQQPEAHCSGDDKVLHLRQVVLGKLKLRLIKHEIKYYYRYLGSLTTPPCDERVTWTVLSKVNTISLEQVKALKAPLCRVNKHNNRPVQRLNWRQVQEFHSYC